MTNSTAHDDQPVGRTEADRLARATCLTRRWQVGTTSVAAGLSTGLAAQGMTGVFTDVLGWHVAAAILFAGFLEVALVASALGARYAVLKGRPLGANGAATWVLSATSGLLAAAHELIGRQGSTWVWQDDAGSVLAGVVRLVAPLVACWCWDRILGADRRDVTGRTFSTGKRNRRYLRLARAALAVHQARESGTGTAMSRSKIRRAERRRYRATVALHRVVPPTDPDVESETQAWIDAFLAPDRYSYRSRRTSGAGTRREPGPVPEKSTVVHDSPAASAARPAKAEPPARTATTTGEAGDVMARVLAAIAAGELPPAPSGEKIRQHLRVGNGPAKEAARLIKTQHGRVDRGALHVVHGSHEPPDAHPPAHITRAHTGGPDDHDL